MTPHETPVADLLLDQQDAGVWGIAMNAYRRDREAGMSRLDAFRALEPLLEHPRLGPAARIMQDLVKRFPE